MAIIKSYTDLEQSKKLAGILPLESADMVLLHEEPYEASDSKFDGLHQALYVPFNKYDKSWRQKYKNISYFPCWSIAALLEQLKSEIILENKQILFLHLNKYDDNSYEIRYTNSWTGEVLIAEADNPVDACVAMIEKLNELKVL